MTGEQQVALNTRGEGLAQLAAVGRLIQATGRTTLTAAMDDQSALEGYRGHGVFTFALLDGLARGDRNGNGLVEVTELLEHVDGLVPEITDKTWHVRQTPRSLFQGSNFALTKQLPSLTPAPGEEMIISTTPTHVVTELVEVLKSAGVTDTVVQKLAAVHDADLDPHRTGLGSRRQGWQGARIRRGREAPYAAVIGSFNGSR